MKIATWNVNSIRVRLEQLTQWLKANPLDVIALQETKCEVEKFPFEVLQELGYHAICLGQPSYNGVAILAKEPLTSLELNLPEVLADQKRVIATYYRDILILDLYIPNGQAVGSEKYEYKMQWLKAVCELIAKLKQQYPKMIVLGDYNIAPTELDHTSANFIKDKIMISDPEREAFEAMINLGFVDSFRLFNQEPKQYTWWDYRIRAFDKNLGYRIDHILVSDALKSQCESCVVDLPMRALEKPSDHAPVILTLKS